MLKILVTSRRCFFSTSSIKRRGLTPPSALRVAKSISPQQIETLKSRYKQPIERLLQSNKYKVGIISKPLLNVHLDNIANKDVIEELFIQNGLDKGDEIKQAIDSFRSFCLSDKDIGEELFDVIKKVLSFESHSDELFPYILRHAFQKNPGLVHHKIYKSYLDLSKPESYYPEARAMSRHIIYHYGPTNSGKTYTALEEFFKSKSAIYCSPLKLLAYEIYKKAKLKNCEIDLITGDEKIFEKSKDLPVNHMACTIEMADKDREFDLAIIDEVQMIGDLSRGNAWTQAILGLKCKEIHLCGDESGLDLVKRLSKICGDTFTSHKYDRLSQLIIEKNPLANVSQIRDGDCIVCFSKKYIYKISEILSENKIEHAIIYGTMPPAIKMEQSNKFNDPNSKTKVLVATDAIGMGLNLNIRRIIFSGIKRISIVENQHESANRILISSMKQISGRAGRFKTKYCTGQVTCFSREILDTLHNILNKSLESIPRAIIFPDFDCLYSLSLLMKTNSMVEILKLIEKESSVEESTFELFFSDQMKYIAHIVDNYTFSFFDKYNILLCPINIKSKLAVHCLNVICSKLEDRSIISLDDFFEAHLESLRPPNTGEQALLLEEIYDVCSVYMWLSYRIKKYFIFTEDCKLMRSKLEEWMTDFFKKQSFNSTLTPNASCVSQKPSECLEAMKKDQKKIPMNNKDKKTTNLYQNEQISQNKIKKAVEKMGKMKNNQKNSRNDASTQINKIRKK